MPIIYTAILGCLIAGVVFSPLFSAFGPASIRFRMEIGKVRVLLTSTKNYQKNLGHQLHYVAVFAVINGFIDMVFNTVWYLTKRSYF
jgi:acyl-coenzyme A synthetase/AMP-(fatty) acid ligase